MQAERSWRLAEKVQCALLLESLRPNMRYREYVNAQKSRNPCLTGLSEYLTRPARSRRCRIIALDFFHGAELPRRSEIFASDLNTRLQWDTQNSESSDGRHLLGQLLLIEDISPELIEDLGSKLVIDPWFFASYVNSPWRTSRFMTPQNCCLPSRAKSQNFLPLYYHRSLSFPGVKPQRNGFLRNINQFRKMALIQRTGPCVGLAQHACAVFLKKTKSSWIGKAERSTCFSKLIGQGIILLDPPITDEYKFSDKAGTVSVSLPSEPFLGGPEDFGLFDSEKPLEQCQEALHHRGMLDQLVHHWMNASPTSFDPSQPTLQALSYYPLKLVAAEWVSYIAVMSFALKRNEASDVSSDLQADLTKLSLSIKELQGWRRRVLATMEKIRQVIQYIHLPDSSGSCSEDWAALREDYDFIRTRIQEHSDRLESMIPVVTSFIQLIESRRALWETANVTRLTVLAIVFVPLSYIATVFSMSDKFGPGGSHFWVYFAFAVPITSLVLLLAGALGNDWKSFHWLKLPRLAVKKSLPV